MSPTLTSGLLNGHHANGRVFPGKHGTVIKRGQAFRLRREIENLEFIAANLPDFPIPEVVSTRKVPIADQAEGSFEITKLEGVQLDETVWKSLAKHPGAQARFLEEFRGYITQLHGLGSQASERIGSCSGGKLWDHRFSMREPIQSFASVHAFHDYLISLVDKEVVEQFWPHKMHDWRSALPDHCRVVFAHCDWSWEHVLVDEKTGGITGLLDVEMASFVPEWWEFRKALFDARTKPWWLEIVKQTMAGDKTTREQYLRAKMADDEMIEYRI